jgi:hypothetical protein
MATTVATINESLVDQAVVKALRYILPALKFFSYQVESEERIINDVIYVPIATDPTVATKTPGTFATGTGGIAGTAVTLDTPIAAGWGFNEGEMRPSLLPQAWADKAAGGVYALAKAVVDAALALVTASNFSNVEGTDKLTKAVADWDQGELASLIGIGAKKIRQRERAILLNTDYAMGLMGNSMFALTFSASGMNLLETGKVPNLFGFPAMQYDALPTNSESLGGVVFGRAALCVAAAPMAQLMSAGDGNIRNRRIITDPESGVSVLYTEQADAGGTLAGEVSLVYGVKKGQNAAVRLVSA